MPMPKDQRPDEIAADAAKASERGDHRNAERLYLTAAARASAYTNQPSMQKNASHWDKCAGRERRLAGLTTPASFPEAQLGIQNRMGRMQGLATKMLEDYAAPGGNGIDQDEAFALADLVKIFFQDDLSKLTEGK